MSFVIITAIIDSVDRKPVSIPVASKDVFDIATAFLSSEKVIAFKVTDDVPVLPKHFGFGSDWNGKWVTEFSKEHWNK